MPMKHLRRILMALGLFGLGAASVKAQSTVKGIVIETAGGQRTEYALTETPELTYDGNTVTLTTKNVSVNYTATQIVKVELTDIHETSIEAVKKEKGQLVVLADQILLSGLSANEKVQLYNESGILRSSWKVASNGKLTISLSDLSRGMYIIKTNHQSFKVTRK